MKDVRLLHYRKSISIKRDQPHTSVQIWKSDLLPNRILLPAHECIQTFNKNGLKIKEQSILSITGINSVSEYTYDDQERLIVTRNLNDNIIKSTKVTSYLEHDVTTHMFVDEEGIQNGIKIIEQEQQKGNQLERVITNYTLAGDVTSEFKYTFDTQGNEIRKFMNDTNHPYLTLSEYNSNNNIIKQTLKLKDDITTIKEYSYNSQNQIEVLKVKNCKLESYITTKYFYNKYQYLARQETYHDDKLSHILERTYHYDERGNYILMVQNNKDVLFISSNPKQEVEERTIEYFI